MLKDREFDEKVVIITGGSSGIGKACAKRFITAGAIVIIAAREEKKAIQTITELQSFGREITFIQTDVSQAIEVETLINKTITKFGALHYLINNAGIEGTPFVSITDYQELVWDEVIAVNLKGTWLCMKFAIPAILQSGGGAIVNVSSFAGLRASKTGGAAYTASKHGVVGLTKAVALEFAKKNIRVNCVCPAIIETPNTQNVLGEKISVVGKDFPMGRIGASSEVADAVLWLCSQHSSFITGITLPIDGGLTG